MLDKDPKNMNGGCGIGGHNKMARGTEDRERKNWEQHETARAGTCNAVIACLTWQYLRN